MAQELQNWLATQDYDLPRRLTSLGVIAPSELDAIHARVDSSVTSHGDDEDKALQDELQSDNALDELNRSYHFDPSARTLPGSGETRVQPVEHVPGERPDMYQKLAEIGRGGMGRVSIVLDTHLRREVAFKELIDETDSPIAAAHSAYLAARFLREARITARLDHPGIVPIHEVGRRADGTLYYTMKAVKGDTLAVRVERASTLTERLKLLDHYIDLCQAMAYAHNCGVIHRDIKSDNVMIGTYGETVIIDWGIAKYLDDPDDSGLSLDVPNCDSEPDTTPLTAYGATMGTPTFMAPETVLGQSDKVGTCSDVYSLGVVLYHILTGRLPFWSDSLTELKAKVIESDPVPPRRFDSRIAPELEAICLRALAKDPRERYDTAQHLLDEISRYNAGELVETYEYSALDHVRRFVGQHAKAISIALIATVAVAVLSIIAALVVVRANAGERIARTQAEAQRSLADQRTAESRYQNYARGILQAHALLRENDFALATKALEELPKEYRNWEWGHLYLAAHPELIRLKGHVGAVKDIRFNSEATLALSASSDGSAIVWDWNAAMPMHRANASNSPYKHAEFSRKGDRVFAISESRELEVWNAQSFELEDRILGVEEQPHALIISPDDRFAIVRTKRAAYIFDLPSGTTRKVMHPEAGQTTRIVYRVRDGVLVAQYTNGLVCEWNPESGEIIRSINLLDNGYRSVRLSNDGEYLMARQEGGEVAGFSLESMEVATRFEGSPMRNWEYAFSRGNNYIADSSIRGFLGVWRTSDGSKIWDIEETRSRPREVVFGPHNRHIAMLTDDNTIRIWDFLAARQTGAYTPSNNEYSKIVFTPDGTRLLAGTREGDILIYPVNRTDGNLIVGDRSGEQDRSKRLSGQFRNARFVTDDVVAIELVARKPNFVNAFTGVNTRLGTIPLDLGPVAFSDDGDYLLYGGVDGNMHLLCQSNQTSELLDLPAATLRTSTFDQDRASIVTVSRVGEVLLWDVANPTQPQKVSIPEVRVLDATFTDEPNRLLVAGRDNKVLIWDISAGSVTFQVTSPKPLTSPPAISTKHGIVLALCDDYMVRAWNIEDDSLRWECKGWYESEAELPIHPNGDTIALTTHQGLQLLRIVDGEPIVTLGKRDSETVDFVFHPTADRAASCAQDGKLRIWDTKRGIQLMNKGNQSAYIGSVDFNADGSRLLIGLDDGRALIMDSLDWKPDSTNDSHLEERIAARKANTYEDWVKSRGPTNFVPLENVGPPLLVANFERSSALGDWKQSYGWNIVGGFLTAEQARGKYELVAFTAPPLSSPRYAAEVDVTLEEGQRFMIAVGYRTNESVSNNPYRYDAYIFGLDRIITDNRDLFPNSKVYKGNGHNLFWANLPADLVNAYGPELNRFPWSHRDQFRLRIEVDRQELRAFIDDEFIGTYVAPSPIRGRFGFANIFGDNIPSAKYDNLVIYPLP